MLKVVDRASALAITIMVVAKQNPKRKSQPPQDIVPAEDAASAGKRRRVKSSETPAPANAASSSVGARAVALALICLMCNASSDDKDFVEYDATGKPTIAMCFDCADLGGRLRPDLAALGVQGAKTMLARYRAGTGCLEDTSFKKDFMAAARFQQKSGDQLRAPFMPGSAVMNVTSYGIRVSHVYALLTEAEYAALLGAPPSAIKLAPTSLPVLGPGQSRNYYVLDMEGLPEAVKSTCKKLEIFYNAESEFDQIYLDETTQVHQDQGEHVFAYIAKSAFQSRPEKSRPASVPLTLEEARLKHQEAAAAQAAAGDTSTAVATDQDGEDADDAVPREVRSFGIVAATTAAKPGTKGKRKTQPGAALPAVPTEASRTPRRVSGTTPEAVEAVADEEKPMSESSVAGGKAGQLARLDKDMKLVAEKHWLNHANASVKSLKALSPVKYLLDCTKPLSLSLNGAKRIRDTLQKDNQTLGFNLLQNRVHLCEQAMNFANTNLLNTSVQAMNEQLSHIKPLWDKIPITKQVTIAQRFAIEELGTAISLFKAGNLQWMNSAVSFMDYFRWTERTAYPTEVPSFNAKEAKFSGVLDQLLCMAGDRDEEDLLAEFGAEDDDVKGKAAKDDAGAAVTDLQQGAEAIEKAVVEIFLCERNHAAAALREVADLSTVEKARVEVILKLFTMFIHVPGVASVQEEFVKWATASQTTLQRNEFLEALRAATPTGCEFVPVKTALENQPGPMLAPMRRSPQLLGAAIHFLHKGCQSIIHKALLGVQNSAESKQNAYTLILLFKTVFNEPDMKLLRALATTQCSGLAVCSAAHASLQKLANLGDDAEKRLAQDPDLILMTNVQQQRLKQNGYKQDLMKVTADMRSAEADLATLLGNDDYLIQELGLFAEYDIKAAFDDHGSEAVNFEVIFRDCLELRGAQLAKKLQDAGDEAVAACQGWQQGGVHFWRKEAGPDAAVSDLQELLKKSILALSPKEIKRTTENFIQVITDARGFIDKFELKETKLHSVLEDVIQGPREAKVLYMESLLLRQFSKIDEDPKSAEHVKDMKALVTRLSIFCTSNDLKISSSDLHHGLWAAAQAACS
eukprot:s5222_g5.t3